MPENIKFSQENLLKDKLWLKTLLLFYTFPSFQYCFGGKMIYEWRSGFEAEVP